MFSFVLLMQLHGHTHTHTNTVLYNPPLLIKPLPIAALPRDRIIKDILNRAFVWLCDLILILQQTKYFSGTLYHAL